MELKLEDLVVKCPGCAGTGHFKETADSPRGHGALRAKEGICLTCGGAGGLLTDSGVAVAEVVKIMKKLNLI